jgi:hypothetical protein
MFDPFNTHRLDVIDRKLNLIGHKLDLLLKAAHRKDPRLKALTAELRESETALEAAVKAQGSPVTRRPTQGVSAMLPNPTLDALAQQVKANTDAENAAVTVLNGIAGRIDTAVQAALANGATAAELQPVSDEVAALKSSADALSAAVVANTPAA